VAAACFRWLIDHAELEQIDTIQSSQSHKERYEQLADVLRASSHINTIGNCSLPPVIVQDNIEVDKGNDTSLPRRYMCDFLNWA
jgi:hypothetical protein